MISIEPKQRLAQLFALVFITLLKFPHSHPNARNKDDAYKHQQGKCIRLVLCLPRTFFTDPLLVHLVAFQTRHAQGPIVAIKAPRAVHQAVVACCLASTFCGTVLVFQVAALLTFLAPLERQAAVPQSLIAGRLVEEALVLPVPAIRFQAAERETISQTISMGSD